MAGDIRTEMTAAAVPEKNRKRSIVPEGIGYGKGRKRSAKEFMEKRYGADRTASMVGELRGRVKKFMGTKFKGSDVQSHVEAARSLVKDAKASALSIAQEARAGAASGAGARAVGDKARASALALTERVRQQAEAVKTEARSKAKATAGTRTRDEHRRP